ncbi:unnamed protein product [Dovyalis caffra]|uniref:Uncharacterized protein n=1 Tax=Dovyalis caffra TaxID=77055 RepID=A0AAV1QRI0_9ROSI|nr:unnamed protein product [Dovyalis caffra]
MLEHPQTKWWLESATGLSGGKVMVAAEWRRTAGSVVEREIAVGDRLEAATTWGGVNNDYCCCKRWRNGVARSVEQ